MIAQVNIFLACDKIAPPIHSPNVIIMIVLTFDGNANKASWFSLNSWNKI